MQNKQPSTDVRIATRNKLINAHTFNAQPSVIQKERKTENVKERMREREKEGEEREKEIDR